MNIEVDVLHSKDSKDSLDPFYKPLSPSQIRTRMAQFIHPIYKEVIWRIIGKDVKLSLYGYHYVVASPQDRKGEVYDAEVYDAFDSIRPLATHLPPNTTGARVSGLTDLIGLPLNTPANLATHSCMRTYIHIVNQTFLQTPIGNIRAFPIHSSFTSHDYPRMSEFLPASPLSDDIANYMRHLFPYRSYNPKEELKKDLRNFFSFKWLWRKMGKLLK